MCMMHILDPIPTRPQQRSSRGTSYPSQWRLALGSFDFFGLAHPLWFDDVFALERFSKQWGGAGLLGCPRSFGAPTSFRLSIFDIALGLSIGACRFSPASTSAISTGGRALENVLGLDAQDCRQGLGHLRRGLRRRYFVDCGRRESVMSLVGDAFFGSEVKFAVFKMTFRCLPVSWAPLQPQRDFSQM